MDQAHPPANTNSVWEARPRWQVFLAAAAGLTLLGAGIALLIDVWLHHGAQKADQVASVVGALLAITGSAIAIFSWARSRLGGSPKHAGDGSSQQQANGGGGDGSGGDAKRKGWMLVAGGVVSVAVGAAATVVLTSVVRSPAEPFVCRIDLALPKITGTYPCIDRGVAEVRALPDNGEIRENGTVVNWAGMISGWTNPSGFDLQFTLSEKAQQDTDHSNSSGGYGVNDRRNDTITNIQIEATEEGEIGLQSCYATCDGLDNFESQESVRIIVRPGG